jgi:hypothetical protein
MILGLAARYPEAVEQFTAASGAAKEWADAQRNNIGLPYEDRMKSRLRGAFRSGVLGERGPIQNSNYDKPLSRAFRAGQELRDVILRLSKDEATKLTKGETL